MDALTAAHHESGHAVVHVLLGGSLRQLSIEADRLHLHAHRTGRPIVGRLDEMSERAALTVAERRVPVILAGIVAEGRYLDRDPRTIDSTDLSEADDFAGGACWDAKECEAFLAWMMARTEHYVAKYWPAVSELADELAKRRTIPGSEATAIVRRALRSKKSKGAGM